MDSVDGTGEPAEMLTVAPPRIDQSVILESVYFYALDDHFRAVVLTPACDLEQGKAELITVAALVNAWDLVAELLATDWVKQGLTEESGRLVDRSRLSSGNQKWLAGQLRRMMKQQFPRYHWISPQTDSDAPFVVDFQIVGCLAMEEVEPITRLGVLVSPYREQLPSRYAAYMGRIGTPDLEPEVAEREIQAGIDVLFPAG